MEQSSRPDQEAWEAWEPWESPYDQEPFTQPPPGAGPGAGPGGPGPGAGPGGPGFGAGPGGPGAAPRTPRWDVRAIFVMLDAVRRGLPHELQLQFNALLREFLMTLRSLIDWYLERLDGGGTSEPQVEDIPID